MSIILLLVTKQPPLNFLKTPKYYDRSCLIILLHSLHFKWWFNYLKKISTLAKNVSSFKKKLISKAGSLLKSNLDLNHFMKTVKIGTLTQLTGFLPLLWLMEWFAVTGNFTKLNLMYTGTNYGQKYVSSDKIWERAKKPSKIRQHNKHLIFNFPNFLNTIMKV